MLRMKQEYLFVSAGLQTILRTYEREFGQDWENLGKRVSIHTNDTHPAMCGPELMRILVDEKGVDFDLAYKICRETISFTNHTVMPEALEKWPINTFRNLLPRLYMSSMRSIAATATTSPRTSRPTTATGPASSRRPRSCGTARFAWPTSRSSSRTRSTASPRCTRRSSRTRSSTSSTR